MLSHRKNINIDQGHLVRDLKRNQLKLVFVGVVVKICVRFIQSSRKFIIGVAMWPYEGGQSLVPFINSF